MQLSNYVVIHIIYDVILNEAIAMCDGCGVKDLLNEGNKKERKIARKIWGIIGASMRHKVQDNYL